MIFSYTQIAQYVACPRRYRYRYLDGWQEKDTRAAMVFGRAFENAVAALYRGQDPTAALYDEWAPHQNQPLHYGPREDWGRMFEQGVRMLERFAQQERVHILDPAKDLQVRISHRLGPEHEFLAYLDAIGELDGVPTIIDWKTTGSRYAEEPNGVVALDPQLICYSWLTGIEQVALVVFVRKHSPEIQYLQATISQSQRDDYQHLVETAVAQIEAAQFPPHSGIRFPQNGCISCSCLGLCLGQQDIIDASLVRRPGADLAWIDELHY